MVSIEICRGLWGKVSVIDAKSRKELWTGKSGETAEFEASDMMPIEIIWGILQTPNVKENVCDGNDYELVFRMKPFGAQYYLMQKKTDDPGAPAFEAPGMF